MKISTSPLTQKQWFILGYIFAIFFGIIAMINPSVGYQILGITLATTGFVFGSILAYRVFSKIKQWNQIPFSNLTIVIALVTLGVVFIWIPLVTLKQTFGIALIIGLLGLAAYHLYFIRKQYINPLSWKNYTIGILSLVGVVLILFFMETISDLLMILVGLAVVGFSSYQLMLLFIKRD
jgi:tryptophan-rich sensory protein